MNHCVGLSFTESLLSHKTSWEEVMAKRSKALVHVLSSAKGREFESRSPQRKLGNNKNIKEPGQKSLKTCHHPLPHLNGHSGFECNGITLKHSVVRFHL